MKPKRLYCPYCGTKGIFKYDSSKICNECHTLIVYKPRFNYAYLVMAIVLLVPVLAFLILLFAHCSLLWLVPVVIIDFALYFISGYGRAMPAPSERINDTGYYSADETDWMKLTADVSLSHAQIRIINQTRKIYNLDAYPAKFAKPSINVAFRELYKDGRFPLFFYRKNRKQTPVVDVYIPNFKFIPKDMFCVDAEFELQDDNGKTIANCKVEKIYK